MNRLAVSPGAALALGGAWFVVVGAAYVSILLVGAGVWG